MLLLIVLTCSLNDDKSSSLTSLLDRRSVNTFDEKNLDTFSEEEGFDISACFIEDGRVKFYFDETLAEKFEGGYNSPCEGGFKDGADLTSEDETPSKESDRTSEEPTNP